MKLNQTAYAILGILTFHPRQNGYHIRKTVESSVRYFWSESYGQIYPTLKRLAADGLIEPSGPAGKKRAQEYSITRTGRAALEAWLALPYRDDPQRNEFLLKIFFGVEAAPGVAINHLKSYRQRTRQLLNSFIEIEKLAKKHNSREPGFPYWRLTLEFGLAQLRAGVEWSERSLKRLNQLPSKPVSR